MKQDRIRVGILVLGLILATTLGLGLAQESQGQAQPDGQRRGSVEGGFSIEAEVASKFTYQGMLTDDGMPVNGIVDMIFGLYTDSGCTTQTGSDIVVNDVQVTDGLFSVELSVPQSRFYGQALWLGIEVDAVAIGCQEILAVPYALGLRPGARIAGDVEYGDVIRAVNTASTGDSFALYGESYSNYGGMGVYGWASADTGEVYGLYGRTDSPSGAGVYARGVDNNADLILGANADTVQGDDGVIASHPTYASSDIVLKANDTVRIDLDNDGDGEDADFEIRDKDNNLIFNVDDSGDVTYSGALIGAFPRPDYDSGWQYFTPDPNAVELTHGLGGDPDNYVVDLTFKIAPWPEYGIHTFGYGGDQDTDGSFREYYGAFWRALTDTTITVERQPDDLHIAQFRLRIWVYR